MRAFSLVCVVFLAVGCGGPTLAELCAQNPTDKCADHHNYVDLYERFLQPVRHEAQRVLEIGVLDGDSMRMWEAFFSTARIYGIDIVDSSVHDTDRITTAIADQADRAQLGAFVEAHGSEFDVILDDGGHRMSQQQVSFGFLFPHVRPGGIYIIEDVHTSFPELWPGHGVEDGGANSTYTMIDNFVRTGAFESRYLTETELDYLTRHVDHCLYSYRATQFHSDFFLCQKK